jgi:hypothetical protein
MSESSGDGGPYLSEYEGELRALLADDVDEFRLAGRVRLFIVNADAAEDDEEAPSLFELMNCTRVKSDALRSLLASMASVKSISTKSFQQRQDPVKSVP